MPPSAADGQKPVVEAATSVVVVGANGVGKTRLGSWLDLQSPQRDTVHRVAAQKSLEIPLSCSTSDIDLARNDLLYGSAQPVVSINYKEGHRWHSRPITVLQNDYEKLLRYLFTDEFEQSTRYRQEAQAANLRLPPPLTRLDVIKRIWESVIPRRELLIRGGKVEAKSRTGTGAVYHASEMSDGERVVFYLIGQCLSAKPDGVVVVDEPELHLHRSLQAPLCVTAHVG